MDAMKEVEQRKLEVDMLLEAATYWKQQYSLLREDVDRLKIANDTLREALKIIGEKR